MRRCLGDGSATQVMLADELMLRNLLKINVVYARNLAQSITCLSLPCRLVRVRFSRECADGPVEQCPVAGELDRRTQAVGIGACSLCGPGLNRVRRSNSLRYCVDGGGYLAGTGRC